MLNLFCEGAVGFIDWLDLLRQHKHISCGFRVFKCDFVLSASGYGHNLVELSRARQFECAIALNVSTDPDKLLGRGTKRPAHYGRVTNRPTASIHNATAVIVWCGRLAAADDDQHG